MLKLSVIIFRNEQGKVLLQFRDSYAPSDPLGWSFFGGIANSVEETAMDAVIREVEEELDLNILPDKIRLLAERHWVGPNSGEEKIVYFYEYLTPIKWSEFSVNEGAGAGFFTKKEIASMENVSLLAKTFVEDYC